MTCTFVDAGVLIAAACGLPEIAELAMRVLDDPDRTFVTSEFVRLEVLPKPSFHGYEDQVEFYQEFFANARLMPISKRLLQEALREGCQFGLSACDAMHVAVARRGKCAELLTFRTPLSKLQLLEIAGVVEFGHFGSPSVYGDTPMSILCTNTTPICHSSEKP